MQSPFMRIVLPIILCWSIQSLSSTTVVLPAHAQWSYGGPAVGCTDVLDAFTGGVRNSLLSGSAKSITVQSNPSFQLRGPDCLIEGAFAITFDVASMRTVAVGAGARNVSVSIGPGVRFEVLVDSAAATSAWPLRVPSMMVLFAPSTASPFDPSALPVDVAVTGVTWAVRNVVAFATSAFIPQDWSVLVLRNGQHIPRGSRIAMTNVASLLHGLAVNITGGSVLSLTLSLLSEANALVLLNDSAIVLTNATVTVADATLVQIPLTVSLFSCASSAPLRLFDNAQFRIGGGSGVTMLNTRMTNTLVLAVLFRMFGSPVSLYNNSRIDMDSLGCHITATNSSIATGVVNIALLFQSNDCPMTLSDSSQLTIRAWGGNNNDTTTIASLISVINVSAAYDVTVSVIYGAIRSGLSLRDASRLVTDTSTSTTAVSLAGCSGQSITVSLLHYFFTSGLLLTSTSQLQVGAPLSTGGATAANDDVLFVVNTTSSGILTIAVAYFKQVCSVTLLNASQFTIGGSAVRATKATAASTTFMVIFATTVDSPVTLMNQTQFMLEDTAVTVGDCIMKNTLAMALMMINIDGNAGTNHVLSQFNGSRLFIRRGVIMLTQSHVNALLAGAFVFALQPPPAAGSAILLRDDAKLHLDTVDVTCGEGTTVTRTNIWVFVFGSPSTLPLTTNISQSERSSIRVTNSSASVRGTTTVYSPIFGLPLASIFIVPQTILRNHSTIRLCANTVSVTNATISSTYYPGAYTAAGAVVASFGSVTPLDGCNVSSSSSSESSPCGLFLSETRRFCDGPPTRSVTESVTYSTSHSHAMASATSSSSRSRTKTLVPSATRHTLRLTPSITMLRTVAAVPTKTAPPTVSHSANHKDNSSVSYTPSGSPSASAAAAKTATRALTPEVTAPATATYSDSRTMHISPSAASSTHTQSGTASLSKMAVRTATNVPPPTKTQALTVSQSAPPSTLTTTTSRTSLTTPTRSRLATRTMMPPLTPAAAATPTAPLLLTASHDRHNSSSPSMTATIASPTLSANSTPSHPVSRTISPGRAPEAPISAPLIPATVETAVVALAGLIAGAIAVDLQADTALAVSRCAVETAGDAATVSGRSFRTLSPFATADSCDGLLQGHAILFGTAVFVMGVFVSAVWAWRRTHDEPTRPFHLVLSAAHCPSLLFTVGIFMLTGLVLCGGRTDGARQGLGLTVAVLLSAAGPVLAAELGTRRYVPYLVEPVPDAFRGSAVVCAAASVLLPRGELKPPVVRDTTSVVHVPAEWSKLLAAAIGAWRFPSPLLAFVPQLSALALVPAMLAHGALCAPLHWLSASLFWASAVAVAAVRPRRILVADVLHCAALAVNGALVATAAANARGVPFARLLSVVQLALTCLRVAHVLFVFVLPRIAPVWREALDTSAVAANPSSSLCASIESQSGGASDVLVKPWQDSSMMVGAVTGGWQYTGWWHRRRARAAAATTTSTNTNCDSDLQCGSPHSVSVAARLSALLRSTGPMVTSLLTEEDTAERDFNMSRIRMPRQESLLSPDVNNSSGRDDTNDEDDVYDAGENDTRETRPRAAAKFNSNSYSYNQGQHRERDDVHVRGTAVREGKGSSLRVLHRQREWDRTNPNANNNHTDKENDKDREMDATQKPNKEDRSRPWRGAYDGRERGLSSRRRAVSLFTRKYVNQRPLDVVATLGINDPDWQKDVALERADRRMRERMSEDRASTSL